MMQQSQKIEFEPRTAFGYGLVIFGVCLLFFTFIQGLITNPSMTFNPEPVSESTQLLNMISWFLVLLVQILVGFCIASIGVRVAKK